MTSFVRIYFFSLNSMSILILENVIHCEVIVVTSLHSNCETTLCSHPETRWDLPPLISRLPPMFLLLFLTGSNISLAWTKYLKDIFFANSSHSSISLSMEYLLDQISTHIVLWSKQHWLSICGYINIIYSSIEYLSVNIEYWGKHSTDCQYLEMHQRQIDRKWFHLHAAQTGGK